MAVLTMSRSATSRTVSRSVALPSIRTRVPSFGRSHQCESAESSVCRSTLDFGSISPAGGDVSTLSSGMRCEVDVRVHHRRVTRERA